VFETNCYGKQNAFAFTFGNEGNHTLIIFLRCTNWRCLQLFQFNGHYHWQTFGTSMGNALSPFLANIFMADLETRLSKLKIFQKVWIRYVNDIFCVMKKNSIDRMLEIMNWRHNTITITHEVKDNEILCFLDTQIKHVDKKLTFNIYRKPTATSRYIPIESHYTQNLFALDLNFSRLWQCFCAFVSGLKRKNVVRTLFEVKIKS
jgi:hypothetical protein